MTSADDNGNPKPFACNTFFSSLICLFGYNTNPKSLGSLYYCITLTCTVLLLLIYLQRKSYYTLLNLHPVHTAYMAMPHTL